jgi:hypothetical protein
MNKAFMEEYYEMKYIDDDFLYEVMEDNLKISKVTDAIAELQTDFEDKLKKQNTKLFNQFDQLMDLYEKKEGLILKMMYLLGAEDREKMLV